MDKPNFNPRSPRGERRGGTERRTHEQISIHAPREGSDGGNQRAALYSMGISIHAPREGSDRHLFRTARTRKKFQSTLPARGATIIISELIKAVRISIHAPREGSDSSSAATHRRRWHFNPRSPRGERRCPAKSEHRVTEFQSTLPARGATIG